MHTIATDSTTGLQVVPLWIAGKPTTSSTPVTFPVYSSAQKKDVGLAHTADVTAANAAAAAAAAAFPKWAHTPGAVRRDIILRAADILESRRQPLVAAMVAETSCPQGWAHFNVDNLKGVMREVASRITAACTGEMPSLAGEGTLCLVFKDPVGSVLLVAPWNAPLILSGRGLTSILAAGCTVVLKASELSPYTHHLLSQVFIDAGVPADAINVIQARREEAAAVTEALIAHPAIRKIEFVGSAPVGRIIGALGGKYLKPVLMELGGKCAAIVLDDADIEDAAGKCITGAFLHHGQICFSTERIIVAKSIADKFIPLLKQRAAEWTNSSGATANFVQKAYSKLVEAEQKGAQFIYGKPELINDITLAPALVTGVTKDMAIWDEETFGPSASIIIVNDDEEAIAVTNDSSYGLNASIHSTNMQRALQIGRRLEVGQVHVNALTEHDEPTFPLGAVKGSGWGRNNANYGIDEFLEPKLISFNMNRSKLTFEVSNA